MPFLFLCGAYVPPLGGFLIYLDIGKTPWTSDQPVVERPWKDKLIRKARWEIIGWARTGETGSRWPMDVEGRKVRGSGGHWECYERKKFRGRGEPEISPRRNLYNILVREILVYWSASKEICFNGLAWSGSESEPATYFVFVALAVHILIRKIISTIYICFLGLILCHLVCGYHNPHFYYCENLNFSCSYQNNDV